VGVEVVSNSSLAVKIKSLRQMKRWTQSELANRAMISRSYVSELERGTREPTVGIMKSIAEALGAPIETFFEGTCALKAESIVPILPTVLKEFITTPEAVEYIHIASKAKNYGITRDVLDNIVEALRVGK